MKKQITAVLGAVVLALSAHAAMATTDGVLLVGTESQVTQELAKTNIVPQFSTQNPDAMVAVSLTDGQMAVYEGCVVDKIIQLIGTVARDGEVVTLQVGTDLWNLLIVTAHTTVDLGELALKSACWIISSGEVLVVDGATWTVQTGAECITVVADLVRHLLHPCQLHH